MAQKIQIKSCLKAELPLLDIGEFGLCTDTNELFIGADTGNLLLANNENIGQLSNLNTADKTNLVNAINEIKEFNNVTSIEPSTNNGNILADGQELKVFDDEQLYNEINNKANLVHTHSTANISDIDTTTVSPKEGDFLKYQDGSWKPSAITSNPSSIQNSTSYLLELERWNVKNDGTNAENTTTGINQALIWASEQDYKEVVLPTGTYLIDENSSIRPRSFMTLDLNGSTLKVRDNSLIKYAIIKFDENQQYSRITNGRIEGDKDNHDYSSTPSTHEFGYGISIGTDKPIVGSNVKFITIDNLEIFNCTGDAITIISVYGAIKNISGNDFELGGFDLKEGTPTNQTNRIRYKLKIDLQQTKIKNTGYFGLYGNSYGGLGNEIITDTYDVVFYRNDDSFLTSTTDVHFFDEVDVPLEAEYAKVVLHQGDLPSSNGSTITLRVPQLPKHIFIQKCNLHHCRRLGISVTGGKNVYIKGCYIHNINGTDPQSGIDIEDGRDINQNIQIESNVFSKNKKFDIIVVGGRQLNITGNIITSSLSIQSGANRALVTQNSFIEAVATIFGEVNFFNNSILGSKLVFTGNQPAIVNSCIFRNSSLSLDNKSPYAIKVSNCSFFNGNDFLNASINPGSPLSLHNSPQSISNCSFEGYGTEPLIFVPNKIGNGWKFTDVSFFNNINPRGQILRLPPGKYTNCSFEKTGRIAVGTGGLLEKYTFESCQFNWEDYDQFYIGPNNYVDLSIYSCFFKGASHTALYIKGIWNLINISNNIFEYSNSLSSEQIIKFNNASAHSVLIAGNRFISNIPMSIDLERLSTNETIIKDNILQNVNILFGEKNIKINNIIDGILYPS